MFQPANYANAKNHYVSLELASRLEGANAHGLVTILYDELLRSLDVMVATLRRSGNLSQQRHTDRARSILIALSASLDLENGGDVGQSLNRIYQAMIHQLAIAIKNDDNEKIQDIRNGIQSIATSWQNIISN